MLQNEFGKWVRSLKGLRACTCVRYRYNVDVEDETHGASQYRCGGSKKAGKYSQNENSKVHEYIVKIYRLYYKPLMYSILLEGFLNIVPLYPARVCTSYYNYKLYLYDTYRYTRYVAIYRIQRRNYKIHIYRT